MVKKMLAVGDDKSVIETFFLSLQVLACLSRVPR